MIRLSRMCIAAAVVLLAGAAVAMPGEPPVCDAGGPYAGEVFHQTVLDASRSFDRDGKIVVYFWDFGDGFTAYGVTVAHIYYNQGTYDVTLCVTDDGDLINCCETTVTIGPSTPSENRPWGSVKAMFH